MTNAFYVTAKNIKKPVWENKKKTCKDTQTFCTFCKQSKINVVAKQNLNKNYSSETCIDLRKKNVIFGVQNSIQRHDEKEKKSIKKDTTSINKKKSRKYIYVYL